MVIIRPILSNRTFSAYYAEFDISICSNRTFRMLKLENSFYMHWKEHLYIDIYLYDYLLILEDNIRIMGNMKWVIENFLGNLQEVSLGKILTKPNNHNTAIKY